MMKWLISGMIIWAACVAGCTNDAGKPAQTPPAGGQVIVSKPEPFSRACATGLNMEHTPQLGISFCYPATWSIKRGNEDVSFVSLTSAPESPDDEIVENMNFGYSERKGMSLEEYFAEYFSGFPNAVILDQGEDAVEDWKAKYVTFQLENRGMTMFHYAIAHEEDFFLILGAAENASFERAKGSFMDIIHSIRFE